MFEVSLMMTCLTLQFSPNLFTSSFWSPLIFLFLVSKCSSELNRILMKTIKKNWNKFLLYEILFSFVVHFFFFWRMLWSRILISNLSLLFIQYVSFCLGFLMFLDYYQFIFDFKFVFLASRCNMISLVTLMRLIKTPQQRSSEIQIHDFHS